MYRCSLCAANRQKMYSQCLCDGSCLYRCYCIRSLKLFSAKAAGKAPLQKTRPHRSRSLRAGNAYSAALRGAFKEGGTGAASRPVRAFTSRSGGAKTGRGAEGRKEEKKRKREADKLRTRLGARRRHAAPRWWVSTVGPRCRGGEGSVSARRAGRSRCGLTGGRWGKRGPRWRCRRCCSISARAGGAAAMRRGAPPLRERAQRAGRAALTVV